jgi:hypothetical protein
LAKKYEGTKLETQISTALTNLRPAARSGAAWRVLESTSAREWSSKSGKYKISAKPVAISKDSVKLEREDGEVISVKLKDLSSADNKWVEENLR